MTSKIDTIKPTPKKFNDDCPTWASDTFIQILALEMQLGNIREINKDTGDWLEVNAKELLSRIESHGEHSHVSNEMVEKLFERTCQGLADEGFDAITIAAFANARIQAGGRLPYCSAEEVAEYID